MINNIDKSSYDMVVVGGGIAGLTAAAFGVKSGKSVLLCEKEHEVGGLASGFWQDDFYFDVGIRALENAGTLLPMLKTLGITSELKKSEVRIRIAKQSVLISSQCGVENYRKMLVSLFPQEKQSIDNIIEIINSISYDMKVLYGVENPLFSPFWGNPIRLLQSILPWIGSYLKTVYRINKSRISVRKKLLALTENQSLVDMVIQHFFTDSPAFFSLGYFYLYRDYYYPTESILGLVKSIKSYIENGGGKVCVNTNVSAVDADTKTITTSCNKNIRYENLVWSCSEKAFNTAINSGVEYNKTQRGSDSILNLYIAAKLTPQLIERLCGSHMFYTYITDGLSSLKYPDVNADEAELFSYVKDYLRLTTYEISCPTVHNNTLAPHGYCTLTVGTLFSYDLTKNIREKGLYDKFISLCTSEIIRLLEAELILGLKRTVVFSRCATPLTIEKNTGNDDGAITGWSHSANPISAVTNFTAISKSINTKYNNIYRAGMWSFSPAGLPVSIITGRLAADKACR